MITKDCKSKAGCKPSVLVFQPRRCWDYSYVCLYLALWIFDKVFVIWLFQLTVFQMPAAIFLLVSLKESIVHLFFSVLRIWLITVISTSWKVFISKTLLLPLSKSNISIYALEKVNPRMHMFLYQLFIAEYLNPSNLYESKQQDLSFPSFMEFEFYGGDLIDASYWLIQWDLDSDTRIVPHCYRAFSFLWNEDFSISYSKNILIRKPPILGFLYAFFFLHVVDVHIMQAKQM